MSEQFPDQPELLKRVDEILAGPPDTGARSGDELERILNHEAKAAQLRHPEYLMNTEDGRTLVYVDSLETRDASGRYDYEKVEDYYKSFRMFIGDGKNMREIPVTGVERFRDGGTTNVFTTYPELNFHSPSPLKVFPEVIPTLGPSAMEATFRLGKEHREQLRALDDLSDDNLFGLYEEIYGMRPVELGYLNIDDYVIEETPEGLKISERE